MKAKKKPAPPPYDPMKAKGYIERVRRLMEDRKEVSADISDVCAEAKSNGLEPAFIRFAAAESLIEDAKRTERNEKREMYLRAVGLAVEAVRSGEMSAREAAKAYGVGKTNVYKLMAVREVSAQREMTDADLGDISLLIPHDPETGEIHESSGGTDGRANAVAAPHALAKASEHAEGTTAAGVEPGPLDTAPYVQANLQSVARFEAKPVARPDGTPIDHAAIEADTLEPPAFLKLERATA